MAGPDSCACSGLSRTDGLLGGKLRGDERTPQEISLYINILSNNVRMFKKQRNGDGQKKKGTNTPNVVYFSFAITCDIKPTTLIGRVGIEWTRMRGSRLMLKALQCFNTSTPLVFYYLFN